MKEHIKGTHYDNVEFIDLGVHASNGQPQPSDYPDQASLLAEKINEDLMGILICGSGQGMCMRANKYPHIRAALCWNETSVKLARQHNDANVLCLGGRLLSFPQAHHIIQIFFKTPFEGHQRHQRRLQKIANPIKDIASSS